MSGMRTSFLLTSISGLAGVLVPGMSAQHETILARVVAYEAPLACINGNGYWSMLLQRDRYTGAASAFLRVDFSVPCGKRTDLISAGASYRTYDLIRELSCDAKLNDFVQLKDEQTNHVAELPRWRRPAGTGNTKLPFGEVVPCYRWPKWPPRPAI